MLVHSNDKSICGQRFEFGQLYLPFCICASIYGRPKSCYSAQDSGYLPYVFKGIVLASAKKQQYIFDEFLCIGERQVRASQGLSVLDFLHEVRREMMAPIVVITLMKSS